MNLALHQPMTLAEFLDWEQRQELRYEFDGFQPAAMTGGTFAHARIQANLTASLTSRLRGTPCSFVGIDLKIEVAGRIRYPDGFVLCSPTANTNTVIQTPVVIFEIISPSTSTIDRIVKNQEYRATFSVQRYVILEQDRIAATVFARVESDWIGHILVGEDVLSMPEIAVEVPLRELYEGLVFDDREESAEGAEHPRE